MRLGALLERYLPPAEGRCSFSAARAIGLLVRNLCVCHQPLYGLGEWAARYHPRLRGLASGELELINAKPEARRSHASRLARDSVGKPARWAGERELWLRNDA